MTLMLELALPLEQRIHTRAWRHIACSRHKATSLHVLLPGILFGSLVVLCHHFLPHLGQLFLDLIIRIAKTHAGPAKTGRATKEDESVSALFKRSVRFCRATAARRSGMADEDGQGGTHPCSSM